MTARTQPRQTNRTALYQTETLTSLDRSGVQLPSKFSSARFSSPFALLSAAAAAASSKPISTSFNT